MPNEVETDTVEMTKDALNELVSKSVESALNDFSTKITEKQESEKAQKTVPPLFDGMKQNKTDISIKKQSGNTVGMVLRNMGAAILDKTTIEEKFKESGQEIRMFMSERAEKQVLQDSGINTKNLTVGSISGGGALVFEDFATDIIQLLTDQAVLRSSGVPVIDMPNGNITFPKLLTGSSAYWRNEAGNRTVSSPTYAQIKLASKFLDAVIPFSDQLLRYGSFNIDQILQTDLILQMGLKEDATFLLTGTGTNYTPLSIIEGMLAGNKTAQGGTTEALIRVDLLKIRNYLLKAKLINPKFVWFMTPGCKGILESQVNVTTALPSDFSIELLTRGTLFGYPVKTTSALIDSGATTANILLVDINNLIIGQGLNLEIKFTEGGSYLSGGVTISGQITGESTYKASLEVDFAMAHDAAAGLIYNSTLGI